MGSWLGNQEHTDLMVLAWWGDKDLWDGCVFFDGLGGLEDLIVWHGVVYCMRGGRFEGMQSSNNNNKRGFGV